MHTYNHQQTRGCAKRQLVPWLQPRAVVMRIGFVLVALVACGGSSPPPAIDGGNDVTGLSFGWQAALPGQVTPKVNVSSAAFAVQSFHAISDAGNSATIAHTSLVWDATTRPAPLVLQDAAPGLYSRLSFKLDGEGTADAYRIEGTVQVSSTVMPFRIHDRSGAVSYGLDLATTLEPGGSAQLALALDLSNALGGIDFALLRDDDGTLDLDTDDTQIAAFRTRLAGAFSVAGD